MTPPPDTSNPGLPVRTVHRRRRLLHGHPGWKTAQVLAIVGGSRVPFFDYGGDPGSRWADPLVFIGCAALFLLPFAGVLSLLEDFRGADD